MGTPVIDMKISNAPGVFTPTQQESKYECDVIVAEVNLHYYRWLLGGRTSQFVYKLFEWSILQRKDNSCIAWAGVSPGQAYFKSSPSEFQWPLYAYIDIWIQTVEHPVSSVLVCISDHWIHWESDCSFATWSRRRPFWVDHLVWKRPFLVRFSAVKTCWEHSILHMNRLDAHVFFFGVKHSCGRPDGNVRFDVMGNCQGPTHAVGGRPDYSQRN